MQLPIWIDKLAALAAPSRETHDPHSVEGVKLSCSGSKCLAAATDGRRLAEVRWENPYHPDDLEFEAIVPAIVLVRIGKIARKWFGHVEGLLITAQGSGNRVHVSIVDGGSDVVTLRAYKIECDFPKYELVLRDLPPPPARTVVLNHLLLMDIAELMAAVDEAIGFVGTRLTIGQHEPVSGWPLFFESKTAGTWVRAALMPISPGSAGHPLRREGLVEGFVEQAGECAS
jgi:hypothetical protein